MATDIGEVQIVSPRSGEYGEYAYGFDLKDSTGDRWITLIYRTEAEAQAARGIIKGAVAGVIDAAYGSNVPHTMRRGGLW
jgi:hypothetical protein